MLCSMSVVSTVLMAVMRTILLDCYLHATKFVLSMCTRVMLAFKFQLE